MPAPAKQETDSTVALMATQNALMEQLIANQPRKRKTFAEHVTRSAFNPTGAKRKMPVVVYQNGAMLNEPTLSDAELALLGKLKPGKFCNRLVTVYQDLSKPERPWHIDYANQSSTQRIELKDQFRNFLELLKRITTEDPTD